MADKITKFLARLNAKERKVIEETLGFVRANHLAGLDIKRLAGHHDLFRVRKGLVRIIFRCVEGEIEVLDVYHRNENTYKDL